MVIKRYNAEPTIRVCLADNLDLFDFSVDGKFSILHHSNRIQLPNISSRLTWRAKVSEGQPAELKYQAVFDCGTNAKKANELASRFQTNQHPAQIVLVGGKFYLNRLEWDNQRYYLAVGNFERETDAVEFLTQNQSETERTFIEPVRVSSPGGMIELFDVEYKKSVTLENVCRLLPVHPNTRFLFPNLENSRFSEKEAHRFNGVMDIFLTDSARLKIIIEMRLEDYVGCVLANTVKPDFPMETLSAQSIVIRTHSLNRIRLAHPGEFFDVCNRSHCQPIQGLPEEGSVFYKVLSKTCGQVMSTDGKIPDIDYTVNCGGYLGHDSFLKPKDSFDTLDRHYKGFSHLGTERHISDWIQTSPGEMLCNFQGKTVPKSLEHTPSPFRWEVGYARPELETILKRKTGEDIGTLYDIVPLIRKPSGHIQELELLGSRRNLRIRGEQIIQNIFHETELPSACFYIKMVLGDDGAPLEITFMGAGKGSGKGFCQHGALTLGMKKKKSAEILKHYFPGMKMAVLYKKESEGIKPRKPIALPEPIPVLELENSAVPEVIFLASSGPVIQKHIRVKKNPKVVNSKRKS